MTFSKIRNYSNLGVKTEVEQYFVLFRSRRQIWAQFLSFATTTTQQRNKASVTSIQLRKMLRSRCINEVATMYITT